ncbi:hypothetical protein SO802_025773 [Lithocarpus litseifolius]|uniref:Uncharacterized protein n=1 Tax=Lithocarpus litseifolius TaxID=425828 RepID=A0AAW2BYP3_9ROSI
MFGEEVRSSELETSLSSSEDYGALEVTSPSIPHKAWGIRCSLREKDEKRIKDRFQFSSSTKRGSLMAKLVEVQEKKAKVGLTGGLLTRKRQRDVEPPKDDPMVTSPVAKSVSQCPASPTSSLELIASNNGGSKAKGKDKTPTGSFWDDARVAVLKAHKAISVDDLSPLGVKPS